MTKTKNKKEEGIEVYKLWRQGNLRGHKHIGQQIIDDYGLTEKDINEMKREIWNRYKRNLAKRKKEDLKNG